MVMRCRAAGAPRMFIEARCQPTAG